MTPPPPGAPEWSVRAPGVRTKRPTVSVVRGAPAGSASSIASNAAQMSSRSASNQARARILRVSSCPASMRLPTYRPLIAAGFLAAVAEHGDAGHVAGLLHVIEYEARQMLERRRAERVDLVEMLVIEARPDVLKPLLQHPEVDDHSGGRVGNAPDGDLGPIGVAVDLLAGRAQRGAGDGVRGLEPERLGQLPHQRIPTVLCVCRLSRHCGWRRQ